MTEFVNQVVLITGAKGGVGQHVTNAFLAAGANVIGSSRSIADSDFPNPRFTGMAADLTAASDARQLGAAAIKKFKKIDVLVHITGGFAGGQPIAETDDKTWDGMMNVNVRSAFNIFRAVIPEMRREKRGRIVAIASRAATEPQANLSAYNASKAALVSLVRTAALENKDAGITANAILPSMIDTETNRKMLPAADPSKWIQPGHIAELIVFLASEAGAQITGAAIPIYGREA